MIYLDSLLSILIYLHYFYRYILYVGASDQAENEEQRRSSMAIVEIRLQGDLNDQAKNIVKSVTPRTVPNKSTKGSTNKKLISQSTPFAKKPKPTKTSFTPVQQIITLKQRPTPSTLQPTVSSQHYVILNKQNSKTQNRSPVIQQTQPTQPTFQRV